MPVLDQDLADDGDLLAVDQGHTLGQGLTRGQVHQGAQHLPPVGDGLATGAAPDRR
ncbi:hypothetical protein HNR12_005639 [Streptomonospora nanhaiensis]|uniref:Uncharacterized protein n=1 Tax=Streptomonospora nanhaiensis TaxID=1323731 RepID=A0A853BX04_9ACTN|nr:hypothetical protein [Streptomonospora nanhaiensis]NYI99285.1 hypothetical protein [Streptomonospora nanhaiensis]